MRPMYLVLIADIYQNIYFLRAWCNFRGNSKNISINQILFFYHHHDFNSFFIIMFLFFCINFHFVFLYIYIRCYLKLKDRCLAIINIYKVKNVGFQSRFGVNWNYVIKVKNWCCDILGGNMFEIFGCNGYQGSNIISIEKRFIRIK